MVDDATLSCIAPSRTVSETVVVRAALGAAGEEVFLPSEDPTFDFHANPVVTAIHPAAGTARGGNALVVVGSGFAAGGSVEVRLTALDGSASVTAAARFLNASAAVVDELPASPLASGDGSGRVFATATNCGDPGDLKPDPASAAVYAYEGALAVTGVAPGAVDAAGGTVVTVSGFGFFPTRPSVLSCKFGTVAVPATFLEWIPATWKDSEVSYGYSEMSAWRMGRTGLCFITIGMYTVFVCAKLIIPNWNDDDGDAGEDEDEDEDEDDEQDEGEDQEEE